MRIATLANAAVAHTTRWVEYFRGRGHDVRLWSLERGPAAPGALMLPRAPLPGLLRYPLAVPALRRALGEFAPDLVDAHFVPNYGLMGALAGRHPLVVTAWGSDLLLARGALQRARARFVLRRADRVIADSANLAAAARELGAAPSRVLEIPWGVDRSRFRPGPVRTAGLIVSTRMHEPIYDLPTVIEGVAPAMAARAEMRMVFAGDGSMRAAIERKAEARLPASRFRFSGRVDAGAMAELLGSAEIAVSASRSDSTSVSLLEAMACGAIPVVSDIAGNREWVTDGVNGRLFPVGDAITLTRILIDVLRDDAWREAARARNAAIIAERGDEAVNLARVEAELESLASGGRRP